VAEFPVTNQINNYVALELLAELSSEFKCAHHILHTVRVDVENRSVDCLGNIGGIDTGSSLVGRSSETDLIVNDHVDCAADFVVSE